MAIGEIVITIVGNITADPEIRTVGNGAQVASFTIAATTRNFNRQSNQYEDGPTLFMRCSAWRDMASHCAQSLAKGMRVIAQGRVQQHSYQAQDGTNRTVMELQVDEIGPSLRYATAQVSRIDRRPQGPVYGNPAAQTPTVNTGAGGWSQQPAQSTQPAAPADDPWAPPSDDQSSFGGFGKPDPEPEF